MENKKMTGRIAILGLVTALLATAAAAKDFEQRVAAQPGGRLRVDLDSGSIVIESHDREEVRVDVLAAGVGAGRLDFELSAKGDNVTLRGRPRGWMPDVLGSPHVRARVRVPSEFSVDIRTGGGAIEIEDLEGEVRVRSSGGAIEMGRIRGDVDVETSGGAIETGEVDGELRARTSGGPIRIFAVTGSVEARTSGGPIEILGAADRVDANTSGGKLLPVFSRPRAATSTSSSRRTKAWTSTPAPAAAACGSTSNSRSAAASSPPASKRSSTKAATGCACAPPAATSGFACARSLLAGPLRRLASLCVCVPGP
ncbi:MAG: hypothetical protein JRS35_07265 [Deltaproteobacteria bacterium]|nr:hypothetical protein [Deltaproteobacteria bacterium]